MTTLEPQTVVNHAESTEEFVNQVANFDNLASIWLRRPSVDAETFESNWKNYMSCVNAWVEYTLALKDRMLAEKRFYIETTTHEAVWDTEKRLPAVRKKLA